jgi:hypothetical protein
VPAQRDDPSLARRRAAADRTKTWPPSPLVPLYMETLRPRDGALVRTDASVSELPSLPLKVAGEGRATAPH